MKPEMLAAKAENVPEPFGEPSEHQSALEQKMRKTFDDMSTCDQFVLKNKAHDLEVLS